MVLEVTEHEIASYNIPVIEQFNYRNPKIGPSGSDNSNTSAWLQYYPQRQKMSK